MYKVTKICQVQSRVSYQERDRLHIFSKTVVARPTWHGKSSYSICLLMFLNIKLPISYGHYLLFTSFFISIDRTLFFKFHFFSKKKLNAWKYASFIADIYLSSCRWLNPDQSQKLVDLAHIERTAFNFLLTDVWFYSWAVVVIYER